MNEGVEDPRRSAEGMIRVSRTYFIGGFFLLPWLWLMNFVYFKDWLKYSHTPAQVKWCISINSNTSFAQLFYLILLFLVSCWKSSTTFLYVLFLRCCFLFRSMFSSFTNFCYWFRLDFCRIDVRMSLIGFVVYTAVAFLWFVTYLAKRESWGAWGDSISLLIPKGSMHTLPLIGVYLFCERSH